MTSLRFRLCSASVLRTLSGLVLFGLLTYGLFVQQQWAQLTALIGQDLSRTQVLLQNPKLGASFVQARRGGFVLQFVAPDGRVVLPTGTAQALPLVAKPQLIDLDGRTFLVSHTAWAQNGGTIRLALDVQDALTARRKLVVSLLASGLLLALLMAAWGFASTRRALAPLGALAAQAHGIDPVAPRSVAYTGPNDEVAELARALNTALENIRLRQAAERAFLAEIAHELAAPLTLVAHHLESLYLENEGRHGSGQPAADRLGVARAAAQELLYTSQDLLTLARGDLERPLECEVFDLVGVLERVAGEYPGLKLTALDVGEMVGDPRRMSQVVRNLVRNAVQAGGSATEVGLDLLRQGEHLVLEVRDRGPGMSEERLAHIFERFYSGARGAGVGLTIAKSIVEQHGGTLSAASVLGRGSCFTVTVPTFASQLEHPDDLAIAG